MNTYALALMDSVHWGAVMLAVLSAIVAVITGIASVDTKDDEDKADALKHAVVSALICAFFILVAVLVPTHDQLLQSDQLRQTLEKSR